MVLERCLISDPNTCPDNGGDALVAAAKEGNAGEVQRLMKCPEIDVNHADRSRMDTPGVLADHTPLYLASQSGHVEVVNILLQHPKVDVNYRDFYNRTALWWASVRGHLEIVKLLVNDSRTDVNLGGLMSSNNNPAFGEGPPLMMASQLGLVEVVQELILHPQIDVNKPNTVSGETPLFMASLHGRADVVKVLLTDQRVNVNQAGRKYQTPLIAASFRPSFYPRYDQRLEVIKLLLADPRVDLTARMFEPMWRSSFGLTNPDASSVTALMGNLEIVKLFLRCPNASLPITTTSTGPYQVPLELKTQIDEAIESRQTLLEQGHTCGANYNGWTFYHDWELPTSS